MIEMVVIPIVIVIVIIVFALAAYLAVRSTKCEEAYRKATCSGCSHERWKHLREDGSCTGTLTYFTNPSGARASRLHSCDCPLFDNGPDK